MKHLVDIDLLAQAAGLGPEGALRLSAVYAALEQVQTKASERGYEDGQADGYERGYVQDCKDEQLAAKEAASRLPPFITRHHDEPQLEDTHYDIYAGRFYRPGENE